MPTYLVVYTVFHSTILPASLATSRDRCLHSNEASRTGGKRTACQQSGPWISKKSTGCTARRRDRAHASTPPGVWESGSRPREWMSEGAPPFRSPLLVHPSLLESHHAWSRTNGTWHDNKIRELYILHLSDLNVVINAHKTKYGEIYNRHFNLFEYDVMAAILKYITTGTTIVLCG